MDGFTSVFPYIFVIIRILFVHQNELLSELEHIGNLEVPFFSLCSKIRKRTIQKSLYCCLPLSNKVTLTVKCLQFFGGVTFATLIFNNISNLAVVITSIFLSRVMNDLFVSFF